MALDTESNPLDQNQEQELEEPANYIETPVQSPSHHPSAPPDELFDISTTVDPSYVISLIQKLIPTSAKNDHNPIGDDGNGKESNDDFMEVCGDENGDKVSKSVGNGGQKMNSDSLDGEDEELDVRAGCSGNIAGEDVWEDCGCVLWDLAATRTHAELMVENLILEVLSSHLTVSQSARITEICLGIIGNLACHEVPMKRIVSTDGMIEIILEQLYLDDTQCLCEACRLLTVGLQGNECKTWAEAVQSENVLGRIIWVAENTLNPQLLEKSVGLLLAILETQQQVSAILLPLLMKLGLTSILISLLAFEMSTLTSERKPERYAVLDVILRAVEAISTLDDHSQEICSNRELFKLLYDLVKFPDKVEVASSCATAAVLIANILSDVPDLASEMLYDFTFLQGVLDIFPLASDDVDARSALWNITARLLVRVKESEMSLTNLQQCVLALVSKADLIEDDLLDQQFHYPNQDTGSSTSTDARINARNTTLRKIVSILNQWTSSKDCYEEGVEMEEDNNVEVNIKRLLDCSLKHIE